jgi:6-phosphogluconolactonase
VLISPDGRFLYAANRGHDSLAVFRVDPDSGRLSLVEIAPCGGRNPRNFGIAPTDAWLLSGCMESDRICVFRRHADTGRLTPTGHQVEVPTPVCVKMVDA